MPLDRGTEFRFLRFSEDFLDPIVKAFALRNKKRWTGHRCKLWAKRKTTMSTVPPTQGRDEDAQETNNPSATDRRKRQSDQGLQLQDYVGFRSDPHKYTNARPPMATASSRESFARGRARAAPPACRSILVRHPRTRPSQIRQPVIGMRARARGSLHASPFSLYGCCLLYMQVWGDLSFYIGGEPADPAGRSAWRPSTER